MRKLIAVILYSLEILTCAGQQMPEPQPNRIRHWTMLDSLGNAAIESASHYDPLTGPTEQNFLNDDVNEDTRVNVSDVSTTVNKILGIK